MFERTKIKLTALVAAGVLATTTAGGLAVAGCGGNNAPSTTIEATATAGAIPDAAYSDPAPADVIELDYLDFEAKLQGLAGEQSKAAAAIDQLGRTWSALRSEVIAAGGNTVAAKFDAHSAEMLKLTRTGTDQQIADEAQRGLDLVDEIEAVYAG